MTLPPWLWRVLRSRKTRLAGKIGLCLLIVVVGGFYPVMNWWGKREWEKAEAEVRAKGFPVRERTVKVEEVAGSFFCQPGYLAEAARPMGDSLGGHNDFTHSSTPGTLAYLSMGMRKNLSPDQIAKDRKWLAPLGARRAALIEATRQATPLDNLTVDAQIELPERDYLLALRLGRFLRDDAALAKAAGEKARAFESMEAYFRIMRGDLLPPRVIQDQRRRTNGLPYEVCEMVQTVILGAGCQGYDEGQLAKLDGMLASIEFQALGVEYFREMPGSGIDIHRKILRGAIPQPRPYTGGLLTPWSWDQTEIRRRAEVAWEAWKPFGLQEAEMARSLRKVADVAGNPGPISIGELWGTGKKCSFASGLIEMGRPTEFLVNWGPEAQTPMVLGRHVIALERQLLRHGALPSRLEDLDEDLREGLRVDPLDGKPLDYALDGEKGGFKLGFRSATNTGGRETRSYR